PRLRAHRPGAHDAQEHSRGRDHQVTRSAGGGYCCPRLKSTRARMPTTTTAAIEPPIHKSSSAMAPCESVPGSAVAVGSALGSAVGDADGETVGSGVASTPHSGGVVEPVEMGSPGAGSQVKANSP